LKGLTVSKNCLQLGLLDVFLGIGAATTVSVLKLLTKVSANKKQKNGLIKRLLILLV
jgi:uncharacterized membrane protein